MLGGEIIFQTPANGNDTDAAGHVGSEGIRQQMPRRFQADAAAAQVKDRFVIDRTNLVGRFDLRLRWSPEPRSDPDRTVSPADSSDAPSIFTAVQEQLGLRLESAKGPREFVVIDRVERPSEN